MNGVFALRYLRANGRFHSTGRVPAKEADGVGDELIKGDRLLPAAAPFGQVRKGGAGDPHGDSVIGLDDHAAGVLAEQFEEPAPQRYGGVMVEADNQDAFRRGPEHSHEVGTAVDHQPGLTGTRPGEHQRVGFITRGNHLHLHRVAEILYDPLVRGFAGRPFEHLFAARKVPLDEGGLVHGEIGEHQLECPA